MQLGKFFVPLIAVAVMLDMPQAHAVLGTQRHDDAACKLALPNKLLQPRQRSFNGLSPGFEFFNSHTMAFAAARISKAERAWN